MLEAIPPLLHTSSCRGAQLQAQGQLYIYLYLNFTSMSPNRFLIFQFSYQNSVYIFLTPFLHISGPVPSILQN